MQCLLVSFQLIDLVLHARLLSLAIFFILAVEIFLELINDRATLLSHLLHALLVCQTNKIGLNLMLQALLHVLNFVVRLLRYVGNFILFLFLKLFQFLLQGSLVLDLLFLVFLCDFIQAGVH